MVRETRAALRSHRRVCIVSPTGSGKTGVAGHISARIAEELAGRQKGIALYLVHRKELLKQTVDTLEQFGLGDMTGVIASGQPGSPWAPLQVASIPTLYRRVDQVKQWLNPAVIYIDEAHHVAAATWERIIQTWPNAFQIGMTATPCRLDGKGLGNYFDKLILGPQLSELVPEYLAPTRTLSIDPKYDLKELARRRFSLKAAGELQTGPVIADAVYNWTKHAADRQSIFFCVNTDHSRRTAERLQAQGYRVEHVDYKTPTRQRERIIEEYERGAIQCMTNVELFTEGIDAPATSCIVHARPTNSFNFWRQANGRGMRRKEDGGDNVVLDLVGNVHRHGLPEADVEWELEHGVGDEQRKSLKSKVRVCEACNYAYPITDIRCPLCGIAPVKSEVQEIELELQEVTGGLVAGGPIKPTKRQLSARIEATRGDIQELQALAKEYGYGRGWAYKMKKLYGYGFSKRARG